MSDHLLRNIVADFFDSHFYLSENVDVRAAGISPIDHWLEHGARENRLPVPWFNEKTYRASVVVPAGENAFLHLLKSDVKGARAMRAAWIKSGHVKGSSDGPTQPFYTLRRQSEPGETVVFTAISGTRHALPNNTTEWRKLIVYGDTTTSLDRWEFRPSLYWDANQKLSVLFHKYCLASLHPSYTKLIWVDSRVSVQEHVLKNISAALDTHDMCLFRHYERECVYEELLAIVRGGRASFEEVEAYERYLHSVSFPRNAGLFETGVLGMKASPGTCKILQRTFGLSRRHIARDQVTLPLALSEGNVSVSIYNSGNTNLRNTPGVFVHSW